MTLNLPKSLHRKLQRLAQADGRTQSGWLRRQIEVAQVPSDEDDDQRAA